MRSPTARFPKQASCGERAVHTPVRDCHYTTGQAAPEHRD